MHLGAMEVRVGEAVRIALLFLPSQAEVLA